MKYFTIIVIASIVVLGIVVSSSPREQEGYFSHIPVEEIHTMRVWEDGSFEITYKDKGLGETSETGCLPGGLCND